MLLANEKSTGSSLRLWLRAALAVNIVAIAVAAWVTVGPVAARTSNAPSGVDELVPAYDYAPWRSLPVQDGRTRPFGTYADDVLRQVAGRARFAGHESTGVVLSWMLERPGLSPMEPSLALQAGEDRWESVPFILCDHHDLRAAIYAHEVEAGRELSSDQRTGKYISPADLRASPGFDELLASVARARKELGTKAHFRLTTAEMKAEEVAKRLVLYDVLRGRPVSRLHKNAVAKGQFYDLDEFAAAEGGTRDEAIARLEAKLRPTFDPLHVVALDPTPENEWLSIGQLEMLAADPSSWRQLHNVRGAENTAAHTETDTLQPNIALGRLVLAAFTATQSAFRSGKAKEFAAASRAYFYEIEKVSDSTLCCSGAPYPGVATIPSELFLADYKPFRWAWVTMLLSLVVLGLSGVPLASRQCDPPGEPLSPGRWDPLESTCRHASLSIL